MRRRLLSILLVIAMLMSMTPVSVFATESKDTINYVSIGDSMTNGYCFEGYEQGDAPGEEPDGKHIDFFSGTGVYGEGAYPLQVEAWLEAQDFNVNHTKLALSALRAEDLNYLLGGRGEPTDGWQDQVNGYAEVYDDAALSAYFQEAVTNANLITMCVGNASFGAYMLHRVTDALGVFGAELDENEKVNLDDAIAELDEIERAAYKELEAELKTGIDDVVPADLKEEYNVDEIIDLVAYACVGFLLNYKGSLDQIIELNPDAEIVLIGLMNTTYGMYITGEGMEPLYIGDVMDEVFGILNAYVAGLPAVMQADGKWSEAKFYYAEQPNPLFISQQFANLKAAGWGNIDCGADTCGQEDHDCGGNGRLSGNTVRDRNIDAYNDSLRSMIGEAFSMNLPKTDLSDVKVFDNASSDSEGFYAVVRKYMSDGMNQTQASAYASSTAIYLGIEDAVAESTDTQEIPLEGLMTIAGDLSSVFSGLDLQAMQNPAVMRSTLSDYLTKDEVVRGMCKIYALFKVGNGMSVHPTPAGHDNIFAAVVAALENGYTVQEETLANLKEAYKYAFTTEQIKEKVAEAAGYIDTAIGAVETGKAYAASEVVKAAVPAELKNSYELLLKEFDLTLADLAKIKAILQNAGDYDDDYANLMALEENLKDHYENIMALAAALEIVVTPYVGELNDTVDCYSALIEAIADEAYAYIANGVEEFNAEYAAWVEEMGVAADQVDPALGAAVRKFLTETPADALAILYAYGDEAATKLYVDAAAVSGEIYTLMAALVEVLAEDGEEIYEKLLASNEYKNAVAEIDLLLAELEHQYEIAKTHPVADLVFHEREIQNLKDRLAVTYGILCEQIMSAMDQVDPTIRPLVNKLMVALGNALGVAGDAASEYADWFAGRADAMAGELLNSVLANLTELTDVAGPIIDQIIWEALAALDRYIDGVIADVEAEINYQLGLLEAELKALKAELETAAGQLEQQILAQIAVVEAKIAELNALLESGVRENLAAIVTAMKELETEIANLVEAVKNTAYASAVEALQGISAALTDIDGMIAQLAGEAYAELKEQIGELGMFLVDTIVAAVKKYAPELADAVYDYLYNNPEEVIDFIKNYGPYLLDLAEEYGDEALMLIGGVLYLYGDEAAAYIAENADEILADMLAWFDEHGENTWALIMVYLQELGVIDAIEEEIKDATEKVKAAADALCKVLAANGEALKAELEKIAADTLKQIEDLQAELDSLYEQLENALESEKAGILAQIADVQAKLDALNADLYNKLMEAAANVDAALPGLIEDAYNALVDALVAAAKEYAPGVDQWLYDYLYNHPAEVIAFFTEYGDEIVNFLAQYTEEAMTVLGALVLYVGDEIAEFVINNPEKVFASMVQWVETYGEETWAMILVYLDELGLIDAAQETVQNAYDKLTEVIAAANGKLEETAAAVKTQIEAQIKKLADAKAALEAELARLQAELETAAGEAKAEIEKAIAEVEKAIRAIEYAIAALEDKLEEIVTIAQDIADAVQGVFDAIAKIEEDFRAGVKALQDALRDLADAVGEAKEFAEEINDILANTIQTVAEIIDTIVEFGETAEDIIAGTIEVLETVETIIGEVQTAIVEAAAALEEAIASLEEAVFNANYAVLVKCTYGEEMTYVALGGATVANGGYVDAIAEYVEADVTVNAGKAMAYADQVDYVVANAAAIAGADFITYQMDANEIVDSLVDVFIAANVGNAYTAPDWNKYVDVEEVTHTAAEVKGEVMAIKAELAEYLDADTVAQIAEMEADIIAKLDEAIDEEAVEQAKPYVEHLVYNLFAYAVETAKGIETVKTVNETAPIVLVGMYNTLDGVTVKMNGEEIDLGEYFDYVIDVVDVYDLIYAIVSGNVTFVDVSEAAVDPAVIDVDALAGLYAQIEKLIGSLDGSITDMEALGQIFAQIDAINQQIQGAYASLEGIIANSANEAGHAYIAEQIAKALIIVDHEPAAAVQENVVDATCTAEGSYDEVVRCSICDTELSREAKTIAMVEHTPAEAVQENVVDATCTTEGSYDEVIYCSVCGTELSREAKTIAMVEHTPAEAVQENIVDATCTAEGSYDEVVYCSVCGTEISRESKNVAATGHNWDAGVVTKEPTATETGVKTYTCTVCGETKTEEIPALGEDPKPEDPKPEDPKPEDPKPEDPKHEHSGDVFCECGEFMCDKGDNCPTKAYTDLDNGAWYHKATDYVIYYGLMNGTSTTEKVWSPNMTITRGMVVTTLYRMEGEPEYTAENVFADLDDSWYTDAMLWATEKGILQGYGNGKCGPDDVVTREQMALFFQRYVEFKGIETEETADLSQFADAGETSKWAVEGMEWAVATGMYEGRADYEGAQPKLTPLGTGLRTELATLLYRMNTTVLK